MNWIKENKFLFGYLVVVIGGVAAFGYFVLGAKGKLDEADEEYQRRIGELKRLQQLPTYPNEKNLKRLVAQKEEVNAEVAKLAAALTSQQIPVEPELTPVAFQDRLKAVATAIAEKASQQSPPVKLPNEKFFLGFERYETAPPSKELTPALGRQLKAIDWLTTTLIENRVAEIRSLVRQDLPDEHGKTPGKEAAPKAAPAPVAPASKPGLEAKGEVEHRIEGRRVDIVFIADQLRFRQVLNAITGYTGQFFIVRNLVVKNEKQDPPQRAPVTADGAPAPVPAPAPAAEAAAGAAPAPGTPAQAVSSYLIGEEKVEVTLTIEIIEFSESTAKKPL